MGEGEGTLHIQKRGRKKSEQGRLIGVSDMLPYLIKWLYLSRYPLTGLCFNWRGINSEANERQFLDFSTSRPFL